LRIRQIARRLREGSGLRGISFPPGVRDAPLLGGTVLDLLAGEAGQAAVAKLSSSTVAVDNARDATQIHGGYGFMNEYPVARMWRDAKILEIGEGTSEVQRMLISRELGLR